MTGTAGRGIDPRRLFVPRTAPSRIRALLSLIAPRLARAILIGVLSGFVVVAGANVFFFGAPKLELAIAVLCATALLAIHLTVVLRPREELGAALRWTVLLVEAGLLYVPLLQLSTGWIGLPGFLVGAILLLLRPVVAVPLAAVVVATMSWAQWLLADEAITVAYTTIGTTSTGLVIFGLTRLYQLVGQVHEAHDTFAQLAVAEERARFSRDVHDLLGLSLSAIILKTELVDKLLDDHPDRAKQELDEVMQITRKALVEARQVATGHRGLTLAEECRSAVSVLTTANVEVILDRDDEGFPDEVRSTLATVLRECVTNVLRHSEATWCTISISRGDGEARLEVVNDGLLAAPAALRTAGAGSGLGNLAERLRRQGGDLVAGVAPGDSYRLLATIPYVPARGARRG